MTRPPEWRKPRPALTQFGLLILVLLLATGLRFYALGAQSFWNDEGNTARLVERPIALILEGAAGDVHPPGYYLLLHVWRLATGESEVALRAYSALSGILTVAVAAATSRRLDRSSLAQGPGTWAAAWAAAGLVAIHPLAVYYSQEARMYAQLGLISALTLWTALVLVGQARKRNRWKARALSTVGLAACIATGLYTQYTYILVLLGLNFAFALYWVLWRPWRGPLLVRWVAAHVLGGLLFLPWAPIALRAGGWRPPDLGSPAAVAEMGQALLVGVTQPRASGTLPVLAVGFLAGAAVFNSLRASRRGAARFGIWAALGMLLAPPLLIAATGSYRPAYLKFLISGIAPAAVALTSFLHRPASLRTSPTTHPARTRWFQVAGLLLITGLLPGQLNALHHLYTNPAYARDDYRALATSIVELGRPGDAILLNAPNQWEVFTYYYRGSLPIYPAPYRPERHQAEDWVADIVAQHAGGRLFVLIWGDRESDPQQFIEGALAQQAYKAGDRWITSVRVALYGLHPLPMTAEATIDAGLGDSVLLQGYSPAVALWHPGDIVPLTLFWTTDATLLERYKVFVHLVDEAGTLVAQTDMEPHTGFRPTTTWEIGETIIDRYGVALPSDLTTGHYSLYVGMYGFAGERLRISVGGMLAGDSLPLHKIRVQAPQ
jgi:mannosyltransferase